MGSSHRRKQSRQPTTLNIREGGPAPHWEGAMTTAVDQPVEFRVPLILIRVDVLRQSSVGDSVLVIGGDAQLLVSGPHGVLGEVPPHYEHALRRGGFTVGVLASVEPSKPAATVVFRRGL